jgi:two-component sensor histidine kinase
MVTGLTLSLPPVPTASRVARAAVRDRFADALNRNTVVDLELVVSELVTNSVEHGRGTVQLAVEHSVHEIHGSVTDDGDGFDYTPSAVTSQALRGRGLVIVDALVTRWGIRHGSTQAGSTLPSSEAEHQANRRLALRVTTTAGGRSWRGPPA